MLAQAALPLGVRCTVLDPIVPCSAAAIAEQIVAPYTDPAALRALSEQSDCITFEFENIDTASIQKHSNDTPLHPPISAIAITQDRAQEKSLFKKLAIPTPTFKLIDGSASDAELQLRLALEELGAPLVVKTCRFGYDGKGQERITTPDEIPTAVIRLGPVPWIAEQFVKFQRELSVIAVRSAAGELRTYPLIENQHRAGILRVSRAPAPNLSPYLQARADEIASLIATELHYVGCLAVELFESEGALIGNEIAPRVHNSGHWTIEGAVTSQFENHIRAVCGLPLGSTAVRGHAGMVNVIGVEPEQSELLAIQGAHLHRYEKAPRPGRKIGHVTVVETSPEARDKQIVELQKRIIQG
jgi:5-(carboxyamino)imidazole ribonucleotide synthase